MRYTYEPTRTRDQATILYDVIDRQASKVRERTVAADIPLSNARLITDALNAACSQGVAA